MGGAVVRIVVTGIGLVTPAGLGRESTWRQVLAGTRCVRWLTADDVPGPPPAAWYGAPLPAVDEPGTGMGRDPLLSLGHRAAAEAVQHAGLTFADLDRTRCGAVLGTSKGSLAAWHAWAADTPPGILPQRAGVSEGAQAGGELLTNREAPDRSRFEPDPTPGAGGLPWEAAWPDTLSRSIAAAYRLQGPVLAPVAACATGLVSLIRGARLLAEGAADVVLAGSCDTSLDPLLLGSYRRLGVLAPPEPDPGQACRPFDMNRRGFALGAGGGICVLETAAHARARGARPLATWLAGGVLSEPSGLMQLPAEPASLVHLVHDLFAQTGLAPPDVDLVHLHGTGTPENDRYEARALQQVWHAGFGRLQVTAAKGGLGHLLGAAGSIEAALTLLALRDGAIPPVVNLQNPDPECTLPFVLHQSTRRPLRTALKISLGFGGHIAAALFTR